MSAFINTTALSARLRASSVDLKGKRLLITNFHGSEQVRDLTDPPNCRGFGRVRHFCRSAGEGWPPNPLPIDPACRALGLPLADGIRAQVFQAAACNWRCWYCYVPYDLLAARDLHSDWLTAGFLVEQYLEQPSPPPMIDLTGGQPDLVPEWVPWTMTELRARRLEGKVYLWSDDNLSTDYFWRFLTEADRELVATYRGYGRVCCFKGYNAESFSFNTGAAPQLFDQQFRLMGRLLSLGIDLYAYVTLTSPSLARVTDEVDRFIDRLQAIDENLPLRTVPLRIRRWTPVEGRLNNARRQALDYQQAVLDAWQRQTKLRYPSSLRASCIADIALGGGRHQ